MFLTVAICTWNRADLLRRCLEQMVCVEIPEGDTWELLIVNNACTDETDQVIDSFRDRLPIRRIEEPAAGVSNARNAAVREAAGEFIFWTDDDVLVDPKWIAAYRQAMQRHPDAAVFGGPIRPDFSVNPPRWVRECWPIVADAFASRDFGDKEFPLSGKRLPYGANFAVRADRQREHLYDPHLGKHQDDQMAGEELTVIRAILKAGETGWWVPGSIVHHMIPRDRMTLAFLKRWYIDLGRTSARILRDRNEYTDALRRSRMRRYLIGRLRLLWRRWLSPPTVWIEDFRSAYVSLGYLKK